MFRRIPAVLALAALPALPATAGQPVAMQTGFQEAATSLQERIISFHDLLLIITAAVVVVVFGLLFHVARRYNAKASPVPSRTSHNTALEVVWTLVPALVVASIIVPSLRLLYYQEQLPGEPDLTIQVTGSQWFWSYAYPDNGDFGFDSIMLGSVDDPPGGGEATEAGKPRLLGVDEPMVVPVDAIVRLQFTSADVLHAWAVPAFGVKKDAVPGRTTESWFRAEREGIFYGQCSELCGSNHGYMPIEVHVVSRGAFDAWSRRMAAEYASGHRAPAGTASPGGAGTSSVADAGPAPARMTVPGHGG